MPVFIVLAALLAAAPLAAQSPAKKPFDVWALNRVVRISDPQLSPDGSRVAFVAQRVLLSDNAKESHIYVVPVEGGDPRRLTFEGKSNTRPRWSPDSSKVAYVSDRSGSGQIWTMDDAGRNPQQITRFVSEAGGVLYSPDNQHIIFTSRVYPDCGADNTCNERRLAGDKDNQVSGRVYDGLLYRRWDTWNDGRRSHVFALKLEDGSIRELTPGDYDVPPFSLGGPDDYALSPDGAELCFTKPPTEGPAVSTNSDLYTVRIDEGQPRRLTSNPAADASPVYSPDGHYIAYRAQARPGYESDRFQLMLYNRFDGTSVSLTESFDRWVTGITWSPDSTRLFFTAEDRAREPIYTVPAAGGGIRMAVLGDASHSDVQFSPDGKSMIYTAQSGSRPAEIYRGFAIGGQPIALTHLNDPLFNEFASANLEEVTYESADGTRISGFEVKPPNFDFDRKYPFLLLIHGGPQGSWGENWSYRWNAQVFAGAGFVVFMPNPRGSTGYGQQFTDAVSKDWGGMPYEDIMAGVDQFAQRAYIDPNRMVAAGGSYGGYMVNWILGHTERFKALVSHAGVYDLRSEFGATEELWFPLWEFGGAPWETPETYERWSPSNYAENFKTPTLVVHGEKDYRVPVTQGMQLYSALQMKKVPSRFLYFPDEGHWILKPRNSVFWYQNVVGWLAERAGLPASAITSSEPSAAPVISGSSTPAAVPAATPAAAPVASPAAPSEIRILGGEVQPVGQADQAPATGGTSPAQP